MSQHHHHDNKGHHHQDESPKSNGWKPGRHNWTYYAAAVLILICMVLYLLSADIVNTILSAFLAFCDRPIYSYYLREPNPFHIDPLSDQRAGAVMMWVIGSLVFLLPALYITVSLLQRNNQSRA